MSVMLCNMMKCVNVIGGWTYTGLDVGQRGGGEKAFNASCQEIVMGGECLYLRRNSSIFLCVSKYLWGLLLS